MCGFGSVNSFGGTSPLGNKDKVTYRETDQFGNTKTITYDKFGLAGMTTSRRDEFGGVLTERFNFRSGNNGHNMGNRSGNNYNDYDNPYLNPNRYTLSQMQHGFNGMRMNHSGNSLGLGSYDMGGIYPNISTNQFAIDPYIDPFNAFGPEMKVNNDEVSYKSRRGGFMGALRDTAAAANILTDIPELLTDSVNAFKTLGDALGFNKKTK